VTKTIIDRARYETFGGIVSSTNPPFLAWVDRDFMRDMGYGGSPLWEDGPEYLSAPTEVHLSVTSRCSQGCSGCYMGSGSGPPAELGTAELKETLWRLRDMGVFHVALGGGEAFEREDFGEIVRYCCEVGLVPNLTTNGQRIGTPEVEICRLMGQVNVSIDGVGESYAINGRKGSFDRADRALGLLLENGVQAGINCVVSRKNFAGLEEVVRYAAKRGCSEIEFLKYKPSGRGAGAYEEFALTQEMIRSFYPNLVDMGARHKIELKMDCSFIPAMVWHRPDREQLEMLAVTGCDGGNLLLGVKSSGTFTACSFVDNDEPVSEIEARWHVSEHLNLFRDLVKNATEPCRSCEYLEICRTGCRAVALHVCGDITAPDPECPVVSEWARKASDCHPRAGGDPDMASKD
jgi:radical SAM protein with 4Fe4S-binding SPASM domain